MKYIVSFKESGERLDKAVALLNQELSRSYIAKLLKDGKILVNGNLEKASFKVKENDEIFIEEIEDVKADIKEGVRYPPARNHAGGDQRDHHGGIGGDQPDAAQPVQRSESFLGRFKQQKRDHRQQRDHHMHAK